MFDSIVNQAISVILGLFLIALMWNAFGDTIKEFLNDIFGFLKKK